MLPCWWFCEFLVRFLLVLLVSPRPFSVCNLVSSLYVLFLFTCQGKCLSWWLCSYEVGVVSGVVNSAGVVKKISLIVTRSPGACGVFIFSACPGHGCCCPFSSFR